ncbi:MAG: aminotransferase class V-fold PLP-dependent enzyme [Bacteroidota bacterium]
MRNLDLSFVRQQFPSLTNDWILMDNAGGSQVLQQVGERVKSYLLSPSNVQHGASYAPSQQAMAKVREATEAMATYVNAGDAGEIVMGGSATMLFRLLSICFSRKLKAGEEIIISAADHEANVSPWTDLEPRKFKKTT